MKFNKILLSLAVQACFLCSIQSQVTRNTIVEHFTNTKCSVCANRNPGLTANFALHQEVNHFSIHPSSPYTTCFLSQQNTADNDARTNFYGIYGGTPRVVINGAVIATNVNYADTSLFGGYAGLSAFTIDITQYAISVDSIQSRIVVRRVLAGPPMASATLFAGLVEDTVFGNGGNGELEHHNVLRRSLFSAQGVSINVPGNVGDSTVLSKTEAYDSNWDSDRMATVAILQESSTKTALQSEISSTFKHQVITGFDQGANASIPFSIYPNPATDVLHISGKSVESLTYELFNVSGVLVQGGTMATNSLDISGLPGGLYVAVLRQNKVLGMRKFVKR